MKGQNDRMLRLRLPRGQLASRIVVWCGFLVEQSVGAGRGKDAVSPRRLVRMSWRRVGPLVLLELGNGLVHVPWPVASGDRERHPPLVPSLHAKKEGGEGQ